MNKFLHGLLHVIGAAGQVLNVTALPVKYQPIVAAVLALLQGGLAVSQGGGSNGQVSK